MENELVTLQNQKTINLLPNEMLRKVLDKLEVMELMSIRGVCSRWMDIIEDICHNKRMTLIIGWENGESISKLLEYYNGLVDLNTNCVVFKIKAVNSTNDEISLSNELFSFLTKLFPQVENLQLNSKLDYTAGTAQNLFSMLNQWSSSIVNLNLSSIYEYPGRLTNVALSDLIDKFTGLKRLYFPNVVLLKPTTLARLEHCVLHKIIYKISEVLPLLGPSCTSLYADFIASLEDITEWHKRNAQLVKGLKHLSFKTHEQEAFPFICENFDALQMLNIGFYHGIIFNTDMIAHLARLSHLTDLSIHGMKLDLPTLARTDLEILNSVQILTIHIYNLYGNQENVLKFSGDFFCRFLAKIFPNLVQLKILYRDPLVREDISQHLNHLVNLHKHEILSPY